MTPGPHSSSVRVGVLCGAGGREDKAAEVSRFRGEAALGTEPQSSPNPLRASASRCPKGSCLALCAQSQSPGPGLGG